MNCHAESFFQNCSLIAPSRLSRVRVYLLLHCTLMIYSLAHIPTIDLSCLLSSNTNTKHFLVKQGTLTTSTFEEFFMSAHAAGSLRPSSRSPSRWAQGNGGSRGQIPTAAAVQRSCRAPHSQDLQCGHT